MSSERTTDGLEFRLKPHGAARFLTAAFLSAWLCGWAFGESFVLWILFKGAKALLTGTPPDPGRAPLEPGPAMLMGAFLLVWLTIWTFGGIAAIAALLQMVWAEDRIIATPAGLRIIRSRGPFRWRRELARERIRDIRVVRHGSKLNAEVERSYVTLSVLGTREERAEAAEQLRNELRLSDTESASAESLPQGWEEGISLEGDRIVMPTESARRRQTFVAGAVALGAATATIVLVREATLKPDVTPFAFVFAVITLVLVFGAVWFARARSEWRIGNGRITLRKRFGSTVRDVFEARRLELNVSTDSDGDEWYALDALSDDTSSAPTPGASDPTRVHNRPITASINITWTVRSNGPGSTSVVFDKGRRRIVSAMNDAIVPRRLGAWLSSRAGIPLEDHSTPETRTADLRALREQLEQSGTLGRVVGKLIDRAEDRRSGNG